MRIVLLADSHVSTRAPECIANWHAAAESAAALDPALTIHLGDISLDGERHPDDLDVAAGLAARWPTRLRCIPGNHDMGTASGEEPLRADRLARYVALFGDDHWVEQSDGWSLVGINAQLFGSGSVAETAQWDWIVETAASMEPDGRVALFVHRPLVRAANDAGGGRGRYVDPAAAERLTAGPLGDRLALVVSGHVHQALDFTVRDVRQLWMPSIGFVIADALQPPIGEKRVGMGLLVLDEHEPRYEAVSPPAVAQVELTQLGCYAELMAH